MPKRRQNINNTLLPKMSAITTATFQPISQKMSLGSSRRSSSVSSSFQRGHAAKITAAPMMKKVCVKLYRDLSQLFLNLKERRYFSLVSKRVRARPARGCALLYFITLLGTRRSLFGYHRFNDAWWYFFFIVLTFFFFFFFFFFFLTESTTIRLSLFNRSRGEV